MRTKKFLWIPVLTVAAVLVVPAAVGAEDTAPASQPKPAPAAEETQRPGRPGGDRVEGMRAQREAWIKEIGVTDEQLGKIREATKLQAGKVREVRADTALSREDRRAKMQEARDAMTARMKEILSPEQYTKYDKLMAERRSQGARGEGRKPRPDAAQ